MTAFGLVIILLGIFLLFNAANLVGVIQGNKQFAI
jgi:hypothetical protein